MRAGSMLRVQDKLSRPLWYSESSRKTASHLLFFFNDTATTEIYTLSLHDALPISPEASFGVTVEETRGNIGHFAVPTDRKSTRLNSSHLVISYAVFCLKKKKSHHRSTRGLPLAPQRPS